MNCIGKIRLSGHISKPENAIPENPIDYLVHVRKLALPLFPQFGLEPNVYYIPPIHAPVSFLRQMFGPGAEAAVKAYKAAKDDTALAGLLGLFGSSETVINTWKTEGEQSIAYDENKKEIVRVPLREPIYERSAYDEKHKVARTNCP
jgi:nitrate reductase beta subunit